MKTFFSCLIGLFFTAAALAPTQASAQLLAGGMSDVVTVEVLPGWREADGRHVAALHFRLAPGWKTYWRTSGAAGISPRFDWSASRNADRVTPQWPTPTVYGQAGSLSIGYVDDFILPLIVQPARPGAVRLRGRLDIGICADICVPAQLDVDAALPEAGGDNSAIRAALADQPARISASASCRLRPTDDGLELTGEIVVPSLGGAEAVVFELPDPSLWVTDAYVRRSGERLIASSELMASGGQAVVVNRSEVIITVLGRDRAVEIVGCAQ